MFSLSYNTSIPLSWGLFRGTKPTACYKLLTLMTHSINAVIIMIKKKHPHLLFVAFSCFIHVVVNCLFRWIDVWMDGQMDRKTNVVNVWMITLLWNHLPLLKTPNQHILTNQNRDFNRAALRSVLFSLFFPPTSAALSADKMRQSWFTRCLYGQDVTCSWLIQVSISGVMHVPWLQTSARVLSFSQNPFFLVIASQTQELDAGQS